MKNSNNILTKKNGKSKKSRGDKEAGFQMKVWHQNQCNTYSSRLPRMLKLNASADKYYGTLFNSGVDSVGGDFDLNLPKRGVEAFERIGDRIMVRRVDFRMQFIYADSTNMVRIALVRFPSVTPVTSGAAWYFRGTSGPTGPYDVYSFYTPYSVGKEFEVLYEFVVALAPNSSLQNVTREFSIDVNRISAWSGDTQTEGGLRMVVLSDSSVTPHPVFVMNAMVRYTDL